MQNIKSQLVEKSRSVGNYFSGGEMLIKYWELGKKGPATYIQGGIHGGEITYWIFYELLKRLEDIEITGRITFVPICNPIAWEQNLYFYTAGKFNVQDGKDWNRWFPGDTFTGTGHRMAHEIFEIVKGHTLAIDLHTAQDSKPFGIIDSEKQLPYAGLFATEFVQVSDAAKSPLFTPQMAPFHIAAEYAGMESVAFECGKHDQYNREYIEQCTEGVLNFLSKNGSIKYEQRLKSKYTFRKVNKYYAQMTGFVEYAVDINQHFNEGDLLYKLYPPYQFGEVFEFRAKESGYIFKRAPTHTCRIGLQLIEVIPDSALVAID